MIRMFLRVEGAEPKIKSLPSLGDIGEVVHSYEVYGDTQTVELFIQNHNGWNAGIDVADIRKALSINIDGEDFDTSKLELRAYENRGQKNASLESMGFKELYVPIYLEAKSSFVVALDHYGIEPSFDLSGVSKHALANSKMMHTALNQSREVRIGEDPEDNLLGLCCKLTLSGKVLPDPFEAPVIDPLLKMIRDNQEYLTRPENLPQLAKLGFAYNFLWYAGRAAYGYKGTIAGAGSCEENPKYKIEQCEAKTEEIGDLIYDAWGMHVRNELETSDKFRSVMSGSWRYSETDLLERKKQKTYDEWVSLWMNPAYEYNSIFQTEQAVADHLLCVIGTGLDFKDGYVIEKASGAGVDRSAYGLWETAELREDLRAELDRILSLRAVDDVLRAHDELVAETEAKQLQRKIKEYSFLSSKLEGWPPKNEKELDGMLKTLLNAIGPDEPEPHEYYPICEYSNIHRILAAGGAHESYIRAGLKVCEEILSGPEPDSMDKNQKAWRKGNVAFAKRFMKKFGKTAKTKK